MAVRLDSLKNFLAVVQHGSGGVQGERAVGAYLVAVPIGIDGPAHVGHMVGEVFTKSWVLQDVVTNVIGRRLVGRQNFKTRFKLSI